jgi:excisionase family DNA binding protein
MSEPVQMRGKTVELLTVPEVAAFLRTTPTAIYALIERGKLPGVVRLGRRVLVREKALREAMGLGP